MATPSVTMAQGTLTGTIGTALNGRTFYKFQGIPYAKPPIGELRFKAPVAPEEWSGTFKANKEGNPSYSREPQKNNQIVGSENCLVLNVFTTNLNTLQPVLVYIHGGGFIYGSSAEKLRGSKFLMTEDVVFVTFNYRLGLLGFLSFDDPSLEVYGNAAFKDQVMALRWVQNNIAQFGGDPKNVTIFGESAGGASVHLHVLSPLSKGLFHKAIAQSGCVYNPWAQGTGGSTKIKEILQLENDKTVYEALSKMTVEEIFELQEKLDNNLLSSTKSAIGFVVEKQTDGAFISEDPWTTLKNGTFNQVPMIFGYNNAEGLIFDFFAKVNPALSPSKTSFEQIVPWFYGYTDLSKIGNEIKKFYFSETNPEDVPEKNVEIITDYGFLAGIDQAISAHLKCSTKPIYFYRVILETQLNFVKVMNKVDRKGVSHADELGYLFDNSVTPEIVEGTPEDIGWRRFVKMWTNFAKTGNPTSDSIFFNVQWNPTTALNFDYLEIGNELVMKTKPDWERIQFWRKLFENSPGANL